MGRLVLQREGSAGLASRFWMQVGTTKYTCSVAGTHPSPAANPGCAQRSVERSRAPLQLACPMQTARLPLDGMHCLANA